tara:strand:- start:361 stop:615 length:255 start_codon:yes stop_codon:yes gene_type:complete
MTKEDKEQLNIEVSHIFESGANHLRIFEMVENFIDKRYKAINYTHCCKSDSEQLPNMRLEQAIEKAKPNMDKIKDVDKHIDNIR